MFAMSAEGNTKLHADFGLEILRNASVKYWQLHFRDTRKSWRSNLFFKTFIYLWIILNGFVPSRNVLI